MIIKLSSVLSPAFREVHNSIKNGEHNQYVLKGGRGSAKSSFASVEVLLQIVKHPDVHAVVMRKVANTLRTTVFAQYAWAVAALGLQDDFKMTVSPMELVYKKTGQKIMFFGADDPGKIKSIKTAFGYIGILHFEELDQFGGEEEVRSIEQSILRGGEYALEFKTFNPPKTKNNWANKYCLINKPGQLIHHSTYKTTPREWLGERFIDDAEHLKAINPKAYEHEYLGVPVGSGGAVFDNVTVEEITDGSLRPHLQRRGLGLLSRPLGVQSDALRFCQTDALHLRGADKAQNGQCGNGKAPAAIRCAGYGFDYGGQCRAEKRCGLSQLWAVLPWRSEGPGERGLLYEVAAGSGADCD